MPSLASDIDGDEALEDDAFCLECAAAFGVVAGSLDGDPFVPFFLAFASSFGAGTGSLDDDPLVPLFAFGPMVGEGLWPRIFACSDQPDNNNVRPENRKTKCG